MGTPRTASRIDLDVAADPAELAGIRDQVRRFVGDHGGDDVVSGDLQLVVSELATNVILHTDAARVEIGLGVTDDDWILDVRHGVGPPGRPVSTVVRPVGNGGRGLMVVNAVMDHVHLVSTDRGFVVQATLARR